jgi:Cof subfamily protein (haloacid dehalogenase superfamily)
MLLYFKGPADYTAGMQPGETTAGKMPVRLIAFDLDGTVLNSRKEISKRTGEAIRKAAALGIHMVPATGRHLSDLPQPVRDLSPAYIIVNNGAQIFSMGASGRGPPELIFSRAYDTETALALLAEFRTYPAMIFGAFDATGFFDARGRGFDEGITGRIMVSHKWENDPPADIEALLLGNGTRGEFEGGRTLIKLVLIFEDLEERLRIYRRLAERKDLSVTFFADNNIEILPRGVNKGEAVKFTAARLGIGMDQVMAIGDSDNDKEMIGEAGIGVAMGDGWENIKGLAGRITLPCDEDGAAAAIESVLP